MTSWKSPSLAVGRRGCFIQMFVQMRKLRLREVETKVTPLEMSQSQQRQRMDVGDWCGELEVR